MGRRKHKKSLIEDVNTRRTEMSRMQKDLEADPELFEKFMNEETAWRYKKLKGYKVRGCRKTRNQNRR